MKRNPPNDMTSVGGQTDTGFLAAESRISFEALSAQQRRWQISYTMHDGLDVDKREIRKCKFPPISPPRKSGLRPHIWRLTKTLSESLRAYLSLSVLKITKPGTNLVASVNQRSPHCSEEWWPGGFMGDFIHFISNVHIFLIFWFNGQSNGFFWKLNQMPEKSEEVDQEIHFHSILRLWAGLVWVVEEPFVDRRSRCCFNADRRCCFNHTIPYQDQDAALMAGFCWHKSNAGRRRADQILIKLGIENVSILRQGKSKIHFEGEKFKLEIKLN